MYPSRPSPFILISVAVAVALISFSLWYTMREPTAEDIIEATYSELLRDVRAIQPDDHVYGNPNAPITFIVYTDFSCPYCKDYHLIISGIIEQYGKNGTVSLVYRNIPFVQIHPDSPMYAHAAECVASIGGNTAYWKFVDSFFAGYDTNDRTTPEELFAYAEKVGVTGQEFRTCMQSNRFMDRIEKDYREATGIGAQASPFTVVIEPDIRRSYEGSRAFVEIAGALLSSVQTFEESGLIPKEEEVQPTVTQPAVLESATSTLESDSMLASTTQESSILP